MKALLLLLLVSGTLPAEEFYDHAAFRAAIGSRPILTDSFANAKSNIPGVSVSSNFDFDEIHLPGPGHFVPGKYVDVTEHYLAATWTFATPIYAFGGDWTMDPVQGGLSLIIYDLHTEYYIPDGVVPPFPSPPPPPDLPVVSFKGFWGLVSSSPFRTVRIVSGDEDRIFASLLQHYEFTDLQITEVVPEPRTLALLLAGLCFLRVCAAGRSNS
ncbi:MAG TPA: PEP-CTERM sorting domain-containing protein [Bryobacteraceae bacterium]|jgi:hypothetical protein